MQFYIDETEKAVRCNAKLEHEIRQYAWECFPAEAVGCIVDGRFLPLRNVAEDPSKQFRVADYPDNIEALVHSHPNMQPCPSAADMAQQQAMAIPWGILGVDGPSGRTTEIEWFGDQCPIPPLIGRTFLSGVRDCWCLVRDWYRLHHPEIGNAMPQLPRDFDWYRHGQNLLSRENIEAAGFEQIDNRGDLRVGDIVMGKISSRVVNHCGILVAGGLAISHTEGRLSRKEVVRPWVRRAEYVIRHRSLW